MERTPLGWQGIFALLPPDWKLGAVSGGARDGYVRIDDERMPRLQVKWVPSHIDLTKKRDEYVKRLTGGKRKRSGMEVDLEARVLSGRSKPRKKLLTFAWRGSQCGMGVLWNCEECGRGLIAQVTWSPEERLHDTAQEVLASLEDHDEAGGWRAWALDGMAFLAPNSYELGKWRWLTGYLEFNLAHARRTIKVARWGIVSRILGGRSLSEWYKGENWQRKDVHFQVREMEIKGHDGIAIWGEVAGIKPRLRALAERAIRRKPVTKFAGVAWHCPEANRLYVVETLDAGEGTALHGVVESIVCHDEEET